MLHQEDKRGAQNFRFTPISIFTSCFPMITDGTCPNFFALFLIKDQRRTKWSFAMISRMAVAIAVPAGVKVLKGEKLNRKTEDSK